MGLNTCYILRSTYALPQQCDNTLFYVIPTDRQTAVYSDSANSTE